MADIYHDFPIKAPPQRVYLEGHGDQTQVRFRHVGWPAPNEHWRISNFCWAMYLRVLRRSLEYGEAVPYEGRLDA